MASSVQWHDLLRQAMANAATRRPLSAQAEVVDTLDLLLAQLTQHQLYFDCHRLQGLAVLTRTPEGEVILINGTHEADFDMRIVNSVYTGRMVSDVRAIPTKRQCSHVWTNPGATARAQRAVAGVMRRTYRVGPDLRFQMDPVHAGPIPRRRAVVLNTVPYNAASLGKWMQAGGKTVPHTRRKLTGYERVVISRKATR